ncbi:MAG: bifunctional diaminohydroxyphosphoribosylaminopyrimidine deaminase/5-amino-6-(5-phosphoribosylamino)uracil reductase RibD [Gemmatimonadaceae bacterium]
MTEERDERYMRRALALAERGWGQTAPNPMVGAVVVRGEEIVGEGWHERFGEAHAEVNALRAAGERARGATVFVTLEPCNHWGKTPPCADALIAAQVARVVIATADPGPHSGGGAARLRQNGIETAIGVCEIEARELNAPFFHSFSSDRPWVTLKLAVSVDGAIADEERSAGRLTSEASLAEVHRLRANSDAIAVGAGTFLADSPELTARGIVTPRAPPLRVVFDRGGRIQASGTPVHGISASDLIVLGHTDLEDALRSLRARGVRSLLVEGGAALASDMVDAGVVDRLIIFQAPIILGRGALHAFANATPRTVRAACRLEVLRRQEFGDDLMTTYALRAV